MPNGHGGIPRMGALAGWRLAYHLHFWAADEYGGAYTTPEKYRRAALRYYGLGIVYAAAGVAAVLAIVW